VDAVHGLDDVYPEDLVLECGLEDGSACACVAWMHTVEEAHQTLALQDAEFEASGLDK